jgi:hypothetical protein
VRYSYPENDWGAAKVEYLFLAIAFTAIGAILWLKRKELLRWLRAVGRYGLAFLGGRQYLSGRWQLTEPILHEGLALAHEAHEQVWGAGWSYCVLGASPRWRVEWRSPNGRTHTYIIAWDRGRQRWLVRPVPSAWDIEGGAWNVANGVLHIQPDEVALGVMRACGWIDITGLAYLQRKMIERVAQMHSQGTRPLP